MAVVGPSNLRTELHEATEQDDLEKLFLLRESPGFQAQLLDAQDEFGRTALHIACQKGQINFVVLLLEEGANALISARGGRTCLHEASCSENDFVVNLILGGIVEYESVRLEYTQVFPPSLEDRKKLVEAQTEGDGFTALHMAAIAGKRAVVEAIVQSYLDILFELGNPALVRPDLHVDDIDRVSWERFHNRTELVELIKLRRAAQASATSSEEVGAQTAGVKWSKDAHFHKRQVDARLDLAIFVNCKDCLGRSAIHYAAWTNNLDVIENLVHAGGNVNARDGCDFTPLHFASRNGNSRMVGKLVELSTDIEMVYLLQGNVRAKSNVSTMELLGATEGDEDAAGGSLIPEVRDFMFYEGRDGMTPLLYAIEGFKKGPSISAYEGYCELDFVGVVKLLLEIVDVKDYGLFAPGVSGESLWSVVFPRLEPQHLFLERNPLQRLFNFTEAGRVHDLGKQLMREAVKLARARSDMDLFISLQTQLVWALEEVLQSRFINRKLVTNNFGFDEQTGLSLFHFAAFAGLGMEMKGLLSVPELAEHVNQCWDKTNQTPLHVAVIEGHEQVVAVLVEDDRVRVIEEDYKNRTPLQIAVEKSRGESFSDNWKNIEKLLMKRGEVQRFVERQYKDRQVYVDASNAILVGAALIASVTFVGWLQPPLGYTEYFDILFSSPSAEPSPQSFMAIRQYRSVKAFFIFNSLSFFFAIATVIAGAGAVLPAFSIFIKDEVDLVRKWLLLTSVLLVFSITFVVGAFASAAMAALPPIPKYQTYMVITAAIGIIVWICILMTFFYRLCIIRKSERLSRWVRYISLWRLVHKRTITLTHINSPSAWIDKKYY